MSKMEDILEEDLKNAEGNKEATEIVRNKAERYGLTEIVASADTKLKTLETQAENGGGSAAEVGKRTEDVDAEIDQVKAETAKQVAEVTGEKVDKQTEAQAPEARPEKRKIPLKEGETVEIVKANIEKLKEHVKNLEEFFDRLKPIDDWIDIQKDIERMGNENSINVNFKDIYKQDLVKKQLELLTKLGLDNTIQTVGSMGELQHETSNRMREYIKDNNLGNPALYGMSNGAFSMLRDLDQRIELEQNKL